MDGAWRTCVYYEAKVEKGTQDEQNMGMHSMNAAMIMCSGDPWSSMDEQRTLYLWQSL